MLKKEPSKRPSIKDVMKHPKIQGVLAQIQSGNKLAEATNMIDAATAQNADDDRDDDDANEAEMSAGAKRADLFDVDPLQKLSLDEFIQEIEKKCGSQAAQAYKLLE